MALKVGDQIGSFTVMVANERPPRRYGGPWFEAARDVDGRPFSLMANTEDRLRARVESWERDRRSRKDGGAVAKPKTMVKVRGGSPPPVSPKPTSDGEGAMAA